MAIADGRTPTSLTMMIRAGSKNSRLNHAIAQVRERNRTNHLLFHKFSGEKLNDDFPRQARDKHELNVAFFSVRRFWAHLGSGEAAAHRRSDVRGQHRPRRFGAAGSRLPRLDLRAEPFPLGAREHERFLSRRVVPYRGACGVPRYVLRIAQQSPKFCTFGHCFQGRFFKLPLLRVTFNGKLGDYYAARQRRFCAIPCEKPNICQDRLGTNIERKRFNSKRAVFWHRCVAERCRVLGAEDALFVVAK